MTVALVVAVLILLNALFVAAEFALVGAPRQAVARLARKGDPLARLVRHSLSDARRQDRWIATAQLGITSVSLALGMYGEHALAEWIAARLEALGELRWIGAHTLASAAAVAFLSYLHVVIGEMVPKSLALQSPIATARAVAVPMRAVELALYPFVVVLNGIGNGVLRLAGVRRTAGGEERYRTADELALIVAESGESGLLAREPSRVVQELLEFGDRTAGEVMVPRTRMVALPLGTGRDAVAEVLAATPHTRYPVTGEGPDDILGAVHVKDLLRALPGDGAVHHDLVREIPFVPEGHPLDRLLADMRRARAHMAVVMDEDGGTAGIVTLEDVFEEVVGELGAPGSRRPVHRDTTGTVRVAGTARLDELGEALGLVLEHEEVDTVGGLVLATMGRPPEVGDRIEHEDVVLEVTAVRGRGVEEARVVSAPEPV